jgi:hypothetical protein
MMKKLLLIYILFLIVCSQIAGQNLEIFGGANGNILYSFRNNRNSGDLTTTKYSFGMGYNMGVGLDDIFLDSIPLRFTLHVVNYGGIINSSWYSLAGSGSTKAIIKNYKIEYGIYPLNFLLFSKKLKINIGLEFGTLIHNKTEGYKSVGQYGYPNTNISLNDSSVEINRKQSLGLSGRIAYEINIANGWFIVPQYSLYIGLSGEFKEIDVNPSSFRQYLEIGIEKRFKHLYLLN